MHVLETLLRGGVTSSRSVGADEAQPAGGCNPTQSTLGIESKNGDFFGYHPKKVCPPPWRSKKLCPPRGFESAEGGMADAKRQNGSLPLAFSNSPLTAFFHRSGRGGWISASSLRRPPRLGVPVERVRRSQTRRKRAEVSSIYDGRRTFRRVLTRAQSGSFVAEKFSSGSTHPFVGRVHLDNARAEKNQAFPPLAGSGQCSSPVAKPS
jgi:hypothetical protein